jgi:hypothetical protein
MADNPSAAAPEQPVSALSQAISRSKKSKKKKKKGGSKKKKAFVSFDYQLGNFLSV